MTIRSSSRISRNSALAGAGFRCHAVDFIGEAGFDYVLSVVNGTATVTDGQIGLSQSITGGLGPWQYTGDGSHTCSEDSVNYGGDGTYSAQVDNTATVDGVDADPVSDDATTEYTCQLPALAKVIKSDTNVRQLEVDFFNMVAESLEAPPAEAVGLIAS